MINYSVLTIGVRPIIMGFNLVFSEKKKKDSNYKIVLGLSCTLSGEIKYNDLI